MNKRLNYFPIMLVVMGFCLQACKKDFLEAKPSTAILQPKTLDELEGLMGNSVPFLSPALPTLSADEYNFISYPIYLASSTATERNAYIWEKDIFNGEISGGDWSTPYQGVFYANNVLVGLSKIEQSEKDQKRWRNLKGWALFARAFAFYELGECFSPAYDPLTADKDLGIPLKLNPSIEDIQSRATLAQTYRQILADLSLAGQCISQSLPSNNRQQPSKSAVHALFARIYLSMRNYEQAELHADTCLQIYNKLIDYNTVSTTSTEPFTRSNDELIFWRSTVVKYGVTTVNSNTQITINPNLLAAYELNDRRRNLYFRTNASTGAVSMKRMYTGATAIKPFTGLATDEVYLIKSECAARRNDLVKAISFLNDLLVKRYQTNTYVPFQSLNQQDVIDKILLERRKELIWRNLRWSDLKRLNKGGANITLTRDLNGSTYTLPPNDPRYVFPIPDDEINLSQIPQNQR